MAASSFYVFIHAVINWSAFKLQRSKIYGWKGLDELRNRIDIKNVWFDRMLPSFCDFVKYFRNRQVLVVNDGAVISVVDASH